MDNIALVKNFFFWEGGQFHPDHSDRKVEKRRGGQIPLGPKHAGTSKWHPRHNNKHKRFNTEGIWNQGTCSYARYIYCQLQGFELLRIVANHAIITTIIILSLLSSLYTNSISPDGRILFELNQHCHISQSTASNLFQWCTNLIQKFPGNCSLRGYPVAKKNIIVSILHFFSNAKFITKHGQTGITRLPTWRFLEERGDTLRDLDLQREREIYTFFRWFYWQSWT